MSEYYEGSSEEDGDESVAGLDKLEAAFNRAVAKYFERHPDKHGTEVTFLVVEQYVIGRHNPIHGFKVVLRPDG